MLRRFAPALLLAAAACASAPPTVAPTLTSIPPRVAEAFCGRLLGEGISADTPIMVVRTTQPLVNGASIQSLGRVYGKAPDAATSADALHTVPGIPVATAGSRTCAWREIDAIDAIKHAQMHTLEFSTPFVNPFTRGQSGLFARLSIAGRDAQWFWIPLAQRDDMLGVGDVMPMDLHDQ